MTPADLMALAAEHADVTKDDRGRADYSFDSHGLERFATALRALHMEEAAEACERFGATLEVDVGPNFAEEVRALK